MVTSLIVIFVLMPVLVFSGLTVQGWLFRNEAVKTDAEWELYQQSYD